MDGIPAGSDAPLFQQHNEHSERYLNLLDAMPHPLAVFRRADGCILAANHHFCTRFGLPAEAIVGTGAAGFREIPTKPFRQGDATGRLHLRDIGDGVFQFEMPDGSRSASQADVQPVRYGGQDCWLVTSTSTAELKPFGNEALGEERRYRALVENLNDIVYTTDENAVVTYVSPNINQLSGYTPDEVIGKNFVDFVDPEDLPGRIEQFSKILDGTQEATEYRFLTKTGEIKWTRTSGRPIRRQGRVVGVQGILVDITDRKMVEKALRRSEEKYRILVQHAKDAIFVLQGGHIRFMNPKATEILGYTCESIAERPFIKFVHPDHRAMIMDRYIRRLRKEKLSDQVCFKIVNRNDDVRDVELNAVLIAWEGKPAILNFLRDITLQNKMEAQLRNSQKMEALGTLAGGIAHNFNNLLMGIHGNASLSLMRIDPAARVSDYLRKINQLVESGSRLTRQLLDYASGGRCKVGSVDINGLARDVSETLMATKKHIRVNLRLSEEVSCINADQGQIEQVLLNLLLNAADAMPEGGTVCVETACIQGDQAEATASLVPDKAYVLLKVSDQGTGIPRKNLDRIFEPFFTTKGLGRGTGLGLSTAYGIARHHDGEIIVESDENKGSRFFVYLPAAGAETAEPAEPKSPETVSGKGTILLVEDDSAVMETSSELLELLGFVVLKAAGGPDALQIFQDRWEQIDLVILDLVLPQMSGKEVYHRFKKINPAVNVLLSSGFSIAGQAEELLGCGCRGFLQKPYDINQLSLKVMDILAEE